MYKTLIFLTALCVGTATQAATLSDIDYTALSFSRTAIVEAGSGRLDDTTTGVSNGVAFSFVGSVYAPFSNNQSFNDLAPGNNTFADIHAGSVFEITFTQSISSILFALANDNRPGDMGIDFDLVASDSKDTVTKGTTDYRVQDIRGGLVLFEFDTPVSTLSHSLTGVGDGFDMVFFANAVPPAVPLPAGAWFVLTGLGAIGLMRRRKI